MNPLDFLCISRVIIDVAASIKWRMAKKMTWSDKYTVCATTPQPGVIRSPKRQQRSLPACMIAAQSAYSCWLLQLSEQAGRWPISTQVEAESRDTGDKRSDCALFPEGIQRQGHGKPKEPCPCLCIPS